MEEQAGRRGWLPVAAAVGTVTMIYVAIFAVPPLNTTFTDDFGLSNGQAGLLMSVYLIAYAAGSIPAGALGDRFGNARVMAVALATAGIASIVFGLTDDYALWLVLRGVIGACTAVMFTPGVGLAVSGVSREKAVSAAGWVIAAISLGTTIAFVLTAPLKEALGWRWPFLIYGAVCLAGVLVLLPLTGERGLRTASQPLRLADVRAILTVPLVVLSATLFVVVFVIYGVLTWTAPFMDEIGGFSTGAVTAAITLMGAATIPASLLGGWLADRTGRPLGVVAGGIALAVPVVVFAFAGKTSYALVTVLATIAGFGAITACIPPFGLPARIARPEMAGLATGTVTTIGMSGAVASTYLGGALVDATGDYDATWLVFAAMALLAAAVLVPLTAAVFRRRGPA